MDAALQELADRIAIQELLSEYCLRLEVDSFEEWLDLFTEDTVYEVFRRTLSGRKEMADMLSKAPHGIHMGGPLRIVLKGDEADTVQNYAFYGEDDVASNKGWYFRKVVRTDKGWKIAHTRVKLMKPKPAAAAG